MQYILTEEECKELQAAANKPQLVKISKAKLQTLCTKIANEMPVTWGWGGPDPKPWGCILTNSDDEWYCDKCPVETICPHIYKEYSK